MNKKLKFGNFSNLEVGSIFTGRAELYEYGLHLHIGYGISYDLTKPEDGADAIIISGGYHDEISDDGNFINYEGMGGKTNTKKISLDKNKKIRYVPVVDHDQTLTQGNEALHVNEKKGLPVRVFKKLKKSEYTYLGLFLITSHALEAGKKGFQVYKFHLAKSVLISDSNVEEEDENVNESDSVVIRKGRWVNSISRQTKKAKDVKKLYEHRCQICNTGILNFAEESYAEGAHIKGLGYPHNGPDEKYNILSLCPNHHKEFDRGSIVLEYNPDKNLYDVISVRYFNDPNKRIIGTLFIHDTHRVEERMIKYHYDFVLEKRTDYLKQGV